MPIQYKVFGILHSVLTVNIKCLNKRTMESFIIIAIMITIINIHIIIVTIIITTTVIIIIIN